MGKSFKIAIVRPGKQTLRTEGIGLQFPGWNGSIGVLYGRQPLMSVMEPGLICITSEKGIKSYFATTGGFAEVQNNIATLLCDTLITPDDNPTDEQGRKLIELIKQKQEARS